MPCHDTTLFPLVFSTWFGKVNNEVLHNGSCAFHLVTKKKEGDPTQYKAFPQAAPMQASVRRPTRTTPLELFIVIQH